MKPSFPGGIFSETLPDGRCGADIELLPAGLSARSPDGEAFVVPYRECQLQVGGFSGKMIFCRDAAKTLTLFSEDPHFANALSLASSGLLDEQLSIGRRQQRGESRHQWMMGTAVLVGLLATIVVGYFVIRIAATTAVAALPTSVDKKVGAAAFASMDLGGKPLDDATVVKAMQSIVDQISPHATIDGMNFEVHVIESAQVNAFALPGGKIVVYTGLIRTADRAEQVAAVLAHEMSHATLRHGLQRISRSMGIWAGVSILIGDAGGLIGAGADLFQIATINSYSREQETSADEEGVRMMHAAGIDPNAMASFFQKLEHEHGDMPEFLSWISTHPDHSARIKSVETMIGSLRTKEFLPLDIDWSDLQNRVETNKVKLNQEVAVQVTEIDTNENEGN